MILAVDVFYGSDNTAKIVGILFNDWSDSEVSEIYVSYLENVEDYQAGFFYKRELPCILKILESINIKIDVIVIDGYVFLDDEAKYGLGAYLFESLDKKIPVIGVAKTAFLNNNKYVIEVFRGKSKHPLYISSIGIDANLASEFIKKMHGDYRFPNLLKLLDQETKS